MSAKLFEMRRHLPIVGLAAAALAVFGAGCGNTLNGAKQDAATDTQKVDTAADNAAASSKAAAQKVGAAADNAAASSKAAAQQVATAVKAVPENAEAAATVTPEVKTAVIRDPVLNDPRNLVNVSSTNHVVHLTGHVTSADMKQRATEDAQVVLTKRHPDFTVDNALTVSGGS